MTDPDETGVRRRRTRDSEPRNNRVTMRLSDQEYEKLVAGARAAEVAVAAYVARQFAVPAVSMVNTSADPEVVSELLTLRHRLFQVATALQQGVVVLAETRQAPGDLAADAACVREVAERVDHAVTQLLRP